MTKRVSVSFFIYVMMKGKFFGIFLSVIVLNLTALGQEICSIKGKLETNKNGYITFVRNDFFNIRTIIDTIRTGADGSFVYSWNLKESTRTGALNLPDGLTIKIWGAPSNTIKIDQKSPKNSPLFKGSHAHINRFLIAIDEREKVLIANYLKKNPGFDFYNPSREKDIAVLDSITTDLLAFQKLTFNYRLTLSEKDFINENRWSIIFKNLKAKLSLVKDLNRYNFSNKIKKQNLLKFSEEIDFNNFKLLQNSEFKKFINEYIESLVQEDFERLELDPEPDNLRLVLFKVIDRYSTVKRCNIILKSFCFHTLIALAKDQEPQKKEALTQYIMGFTNELKGSFDEQIIARIFDEDLKSTLNSLSDLKPGASAPNFRYVDVNGKEADLNSLRGKYVYIDAWFRGCVPCIEAFPRWNELVDKYKLNDNIVFLSICWEASPSGWEEYSKQYAIQGNLGFSQINRLDGLRHLYKINGAPTYILIDKNGNMIEARAGGPAAINLDKYLQ